MILFILLILPLILCILYYFAEPAFVSSSVNRWAALISVSFMLALVAISGIICARIQNVNEILKYKSIQKTITSQRADTISVFERATITKQIIEQNAWLAKEQYWANTYWLNWYYIPEMLKLKPIK